jgi:hypothetical protein
VGVDGTRYAAPFLVEHDVTVHQYTPPRVFIDAVLRTVVDWESARARDLCLACGSPMAREGSGPWSPHGSRERFLVGEALLRATSSPGGQMHRRRG